MKRKALFLAVLTVIVFIALFAVRFIAGGKSGGMRVGGDRDEHGCIGSAGYSWCVALDKCIRPWEEKCEGELKEKFPVNINSIKEETKLYKISVEYPTFNEEVLDSEIENDVNKKIADFKKESNDNWQLRRQNDTSAAEFPESQFTLNISWLSQQMNSKYVSFKISMDYFTGGANFAQEIKTYNYDMSNKRQVILSSLFDGKNDYLALVSAYVKKDLTDQGLEGIFDDGVAPKEENFKNFTFDENTITFYFPKYQVAPGANGEQKVVMGRK